MNEIKDGSNYVAKTNGSMEVTFTGTGKLYENMIREFKHRHIKLEMPIIHPSGDVK